MHMLRSIVSLSLSVVFIFLAKHLTAPPKKIESKFCFAENVHPTRRYTFYRWDYFYLT